MGVLVYKNNVTNRKLDKFISRMNHLNVIIIIYLFPFIWGTFSLWHK